MKNLKSLVSLSVLFAGSFLAQESEEFVCGTEEGFQPLDPLILGYGRFPSHGNFKVVFVYVSFADDNSTSNNNWQNTNGLPDFQFGFTSERLHKKNEPLT